MHRHDKILWNCFFPHFSHFPTTCRWERDTMPLTHSGYLATFNIWITVLHVDTDMSNNTDSITFKESKIGEPNGTNQINSPYMSISKLSITKQPQRPSPGTPRINSRNAWFNGVPCDRYTSLHLYTIDINRHRDSHDFGILGICDDQSRYFLEPKRIPISFARIRPVTEGKQGSQTTHVPMGQRDAFTSFTGHPVMLRMWH